MDQRSCMDYRVVDGKIVWFDSVKPFDLVVILLPHQ